MKIGVISHNSLSVFRCSCSGCILSHMNTGGKGGVHYQAALLTPLVTWGNYYPMFHFPKLTLFRSSSNTSVEDILCSWMLLRRTMLIQWALIPFLCFKHIPCVQTLSIVDTLYILAYEKLNKNSYFWYAWEDTSSLSVFCFWKFGIIFLMYRKVYIANMHNLMSVEICMYLWKQTYLFFKKYILLFYLFLNEINHLA